MKFSLLYQGRLTGIYSSRMRRALVAFAESKYFCQGNSFKSIDDIARRSISTSSVSSNKKLKQHPISNALLFRYLDTEKFSEQELGDLFDRIKGSSKSESLNQEMLQSFFSTRLEELENEGDSILDESKDVEKIRHEFCQNEARRIWKSLTPKNNRSDAAYEMDSSISKPEFIQAIRDKASVVDFKRTLPITASMILIGASVGVITPAMPFVVEQIGLSASEYGMVVSAFALARTAANVPSAIAIERHGRRPYMIHSLSLIALGVGGIGLASSFEELYLCRLMTGFGVSLLAGAGTLMVTDISTPLNRASTMAPVMSGFTAGTALGPAIGGMMVDSIGLDTTFFIVGASYLGVSGVNRYVLSETMRRPIKFDWRKPANNHRAHESWLISVNKAIGQWGPLLKERSVQSILVMNASYWLALAGAQMTIMPLVLTDQAGLNLSATQLGQVYMGMSLVQIFGNPLFAKFIDRVGKPPAIVIGCTLISLPMAALPLCQDWIQLAGVCGVWACGSSMMSTAPLAYMSDKVDESKRAQSIALLRTCGDFGFLIGASAIGGLSDWAGSLDAGMQTSAGLLLSSTAWFGMRQILFSNAQSIAKDEPGSKK